MEHVSRLLDPMLDKRLRPRKWIVGVYAHSCYTRTSVCISDKFDLASRKISRICRQTIISSMRWIRSSSKTRDLFRHVNVYIWKLIIAVWQVLQYKLRCLIVIRWRWISYLLPAQWNFSIMFRIVESYSIFFYCSGPCKNLKKKFLHICEID